ncbi:hypothetical protein [Helicobacter rodentium]|uniref:hypothetical protein n=2 Tax=Helicobacter rodentium TaxID=59617 RepID=UPI0025A58FB1|nr:hypothetical protein [Helicobacter rodentium]
MDRDLSFFVVIYGFLVSILQTVSSHLNIEYCVIKVFFWVYVFAICFGTLKTLILKQSFKDFVIRNWLLKTMLLIIPTLASMEASILPFLTGFTEWFFYYFILAETSYILSCILSIHKKKDVTTSFSIGGLELILDKISIALDKLVNRLSDDFKSR